MKNKIISFSVLLFSLAIICGSFLAPVLAQDATLNGLNTSAQKVDAFSGQTGANYNNFIQTKAGQIIGIVLSFVGIIFLVLMIYAGVTWMTAEGNEQNVTKAKSLLINATIGIIIVFAAYAITSFIGGEVLR